jgi:hypothetical protein
MWEPRVLIQRFIPVHALDICATLGTGRDDEGVSIGVLVRLTTWLQMTHFVQLLGLFQVEESRRRSDAQRLHDQHLKNILLIHLPTTEKKGKNQDERATDSLRLFFFLACCWLQMDSGTVTGARIAQARYGAKNQTAFAPRSNSKQKRNKTPKPEGSVNHWVQRAPYHPPGH